MWWINSYFYPECIEGSQIHYLVILYTFGKNYVTDTFDFFILQQNLIIFNWDFLSLKTKHEVFKIMQIWMSILLIDEFCIIS